METSTSLFAGDVISAWRIKRCNTSDVLFFLLLFTDAEDLHTLHTRAGHHDLLRRPDSEPDADAQRWLRTAHRPRVRLCGPALTSGDGRHRNRAPQCHLPDLWRYCKHTRGTKRVVQRNGVQFDVYMEFEMKYMSVF